MDLSEETRGDNRLQQIMCDYQIDPNIKEEICKLIEKVQFLL